MFQSSFLRWSLLCLKRKVLYEFSQKCLKTTERHSLAVCGSLCGEKQFLLIFFPFYWLDKKKVVYTNPNFPQYLSLSSMVSKTNFLGISVLISVIVTFMSKKKSSLLITRKKLKTTERKSLAICSSFVEKNSFY